MLTIIYGFLYGTFIASFLQCFCFHLVRNTLSSFYFSRSRCDSCQTLLKWSSLIPIVSFILQHGQCRYCKNSISTFYFYHEWLSGIVYAYFFSSVELSSHFILHLIFLGLIHILLLTDIMAFWLPDIFQLVLLFIIYLIGFSPFIDWLIYLYISVILSLFYLIKSNWIGAGDIKLILLLTLLIGTDLFPYFLLLSACIGLLWILISQKNKIPFGPSIIISFLIIYSINL